ncbi:MAG: DNA-binding protein [Chromatiales bacterium]|nr:DNA-binding protein [Chromatiales bacterium]
MAQTPEKIREEFARHGLSVAEWARHHGFSPALVHQVLAGKLRCMRGQSHVIAVRLGLKSGVVGEVADLPFYEGENQECADSTDNHRPK